MITQYDVMHKSGRMAGAVLRRFLETQLAQAFALSATAGYAVYLVLGALRGFTLIPATTLVLAATPFFPPGPLWIATLAGILISSASIYGFSGALGLERRLAAKHPEKVATIKSLLERHQLPIIIGWSFFPLAPTDLICYVCGILRVGLVRMLIGVAIGEGAICAIYIYGADSLLRWLRWK
jgi:uncharacterized membrane protein YdjX (TVP38/TMEM64 family)